MASSDLSQNIKSGILSSGDSRVYVPSNRPEQYVSRQKEYFAKRTASFREQKLQYASDFFVGRVQGLVLEDPTAWITTKFRMAEVVRPSSAIQRDFDDYKMVMMEDPAIDYIPQGAKFEAMGSIWLMWNPANVSAPGATGIVRRCKAVWNHLDYYGNILSEPMVCETVRAAANDNDFQQWELIPTGYYNIAAQYNEWTAQLNLNSRLIFGRGAYHITGFTDFLQEFTGNFDSVRMVMFTARYEEPNERIDDMENHIAGGKEFSWSVGISGTPTITEGETTQMTAESVRNGNSVADTTEFPVSYRWESADEDIATVDDTGLVTGVSAGTTTIRCILVQNPAYTSSITVTVEEASEDQASVRFLTAIPQKMRAYDHISISAAYFEGGNRTDQNISFHFTGASAGSYTVESGNDNTIELYCWGGSVVPLIITAKHGTHEATATVELIGI